MPAIVTRHDAKLKPPLRAVAPRLPVLGQGGLGGRHWSAVVTYREDRIRIISVRRARDEEIRTYEV
jgi:uncharacterized DUF497 family protein